MPNSESLDSIQLQISADAQQAEASLDRLCKSLDNLKGSLSGVGRLSNKVNQLNISLSGLSVIDTAKLSSIANSVKKMGSINVKASGVNLLTNSLTRLVNESSNFDPAKMKKITDSLKEISFAGTASKEMLAFVRSISLFVRSGEKMKETAEAFPKLAAELEMFFASMQSVTVSDNTVRMAEALATIARNGAKAGKAMDALQGQTSNTTRHFNIATAAGKAFGSALNSILKTLKKMGAGAWTGLKNLFTTISGLGKASPAVTGLTGNIKTLLGTMIGFHGIVGLFNWSKQMMKMGADVTEIDHIVKSVFGENMVDEVEDWATQAVEKFGIASTAAKQYAGTLNAMFQASNIAQQDASKMSMDLVGLAGDLSAFYNIDTETAYNKIKSGMAGMVRPLRDLGIDLSVATLKEYALAQGITKSWTSMTQAEKVMLRYRYLMDNTKQQQGDFARTNLSLANSFRTLRAYLAEITRQIGVGFGAAIRHAVVGLNTLMKYVLKASQAFANFMQKIFGKYEGGASFADMDMSGMSDDMGDFADGADSAADGLDDASDAAEKLKKDLSVLPFDELNQLNKDKEKTTTTSGKGADVGGDIGGLGDTDKYGEGMFANSIRESERELTDFEKFLKDWHDKCAKSLDAKDWEGLGANIAWGINTGIKTLYDALDPEKVSEKINPWIDAFSTTFNSLVDHINWEQFGGLIGRWITNAVNAMNRLLDPKTGIDFENLGRKLGDGFNGMIRNINWRGVGNLISNKFMVGWRIFSGFVKKLDAKDVGNALRDAIGGVVEKLDAETIGSSLGTFVTKCATIIKTGFGKKETWIELGTKIGNGINAFLRGFDGKEVAEAANSIIDALKTAIGTAFSTTDKTELIKDIKDFITNLDWIGIAEFVAPLILIKMIPTFAASIIGHIGLKTAISGAVSKVLASSVTTAGASTAVTTAGSTAASSIGTAVTTGIGAISVPVLAAAGILGVALIGKIWGDTEEGKAEMERCRTAFTTDVETGLHGVEGAFDGTGYSIKQKQKDTADAIIRENTRWKDQLLWQIIPAYVEANGTAAGSVAELRNAVYQNDNDMIAKIEEWARENTGYTGQIVSADKAVEKQSNDTKDAIIGNLSATGTSIGLLATTMSGFKDTSIKDLSTVGGEAEKLAKKHKEQLETNASASVNKLAKDTKDSADSTTKNWQNLADTGTKAVETMYTSIETKLGQLAISFGEAGKKCAEAFSKSIDVADMVSKAFSKKNMKEATSDAYDAGAGIGEQFANGIKSIDIPTPSIDVDYYSTESFDDGKYRYTYQIPHYKVGWYKRGGLFTDASIVGLAEAGTEAALPLENKRAMNMIANAIIDNSNGSFGMDENAMANAVARGYVQAMMANQGNERPIDVYATLYTENNEVLARAVQRGQRSIDYRNNPSPAFNY